MTIDRYGNTDFNSGVHFSGSGQVGIGTTSPEAGHTTGAGLTIFNNGTIGSTNNFTNARISSSLLIKANDNQFLAFDNNEISQYGDDLHIGALGNGTADGNVRVKAGISSLNTRMYISSSGNIGIGTTTPAVPLEVHQGDKTQIISDRDGNGTNIQLRRSGTHRLSLATSNTSGEEAEIFSNGDLLFNKSAGGNVGIGTTSPSQKLEVAGNLIVSESSFKGNITASGDISASGDLFVTGEVTLRNGNIRSDNHFDLLSLGGSAQQINVGQLGMSASYSGANTAVAAMNTTNAAMFGGDVSVGPHNNGKLGVGNLTPEYNVDILGNSPVLRIADNNNVNSLSASFIFMGENGSTEARGGGLHYDGRNNKLHIITTDNGTAIQHPSGSVKRMTILETNGRVGIGMESPGGQLGVTAVGIRAAEFTSDNDAPIMVESSDGTTGITFKDNSAEQQIYYRGNRDSFYIETPTKLGLGTNDPIETLDVRGSASFSGHITASGNISSSGTIFAAQFNDNGTNLNVPDYVFEPEYKLKTLNEVEQHISQSKHLPNIPSMDDIKAWSELSYSDRDMKLLEKIEELTLYIIHLQKQVDELKKE
tara:strand:- start:1047 stop:2825 length:1779 start_codon:yes stop_codon:yes gene_type:complete